MLKYIFIMVFISISFVNGEDVQSLEKLKVEKQALELKLEAYALKKKIIEMESFLEKKRIEKKERIEREEALAKFRNDLRKYRNKGSRVIARAR